MKKVRAELLQPNNKALVPQPPPRKYTVNAVDQAQNQAQSLFRYLAPELILPNPKQPRRTIEPEALASLKASIAERGILQPLLVMRGGDGNYLLVAGQRRLAASRELGLVRVPVMVLNEDRPDYLVDSLLENIQREELSGIDEGHSFNALKEEFGWSQREIAARIHKHESYVSERIRTAERLTAITKEIIAEAFSSNPNLARAKFSHSINRKLALLPPHKQEELARLVAAPTPVTARQVEELVRHYLRPVVSDTSGTSTVYDSEVASDLYVEGLPTPKTARKPRVAKKAPAVGQQLTLETFTATPGNGTTEDNGTTPPKGGLVTSVRLTFDATNARLVAYPHTLRLLQQRKLSLADLLDAIELDVAGNG